MKTESWMHKYFGKKYMWIIGNSLQVDTCISTCQGFLNAGDFLVAQLLEFADVLRCEGMVPHVCVHGRGK